MGSRRFPTLSVAHCKKEEVNAITDNIHEILACHVTSCQIVRYAFTSIAFSHSTHTSPDERTFGETGGVAREETTFWCCLCRLCCCAASVAEAEN